MDALGIALDLRGAVLAEALDALDGRLSDMFPVTSEAGAMLAGSVRENFVAQGRPVRWKPLSDATVRRKGHATILFETGRLMDSVSFTAGPSFARVSAAAPYAPAQNFGGDALPSRPFLLIQDEDVEAIKECLKRYLAGS